MRKCLMFIALLFFSATLFASIPQYWQQVSDESGQVESIVKTWVDHGVLFGKVVRAFKVPGVPFITHCTACHGQFQNQPIIGLVFLWGGIESTPNHWTHLHVLDPRSGKIYKGHLAILDNGQKLKLRGYIGVPLLGRTQTWYRTTKPE